MPIVKGLLLTFASALSVAGWGGVGFYFTNDYYQNLLSRFDKGLIKWLDTPGNDIVFSVKQGDNDEDLTNFPTFTGNNPVKISIKVSSSNSSVNIKGSNKEELTKLNGENGGDWTWICELKFIRDSGAGDVSDVNDYQRQRVIKKSSDKPPLDGLFDRLKKDISVKDDEKVRNEKKRFIENCGLLRGNVKNKEINTSTSETEIKTSDKEEMNLILAKGGKVDKDGNVIADSGNQEEAKSFPWGGDSTKLFFKERKKFNYWFDPQTPSRLFSRKHFKTPKQPQSNQG